MRGLALLALANVLHPPPEARARPLLNLGSLVAAIQVGDLTVPVAGVNSASRVYIAHVSELSGIGIEREMLTRTIERRHRALGYFRDAIKDARGVKRALRAYGQMLDRVVYATLGDKRTATLYVDDR